MRRTSLVKNIRYALLVIATLSVITLSTSYWLSERMHHDPEVINMAGTLRYQTYQVALAASLGDIEHFETAAQTLDSTWANPAFTRLQNTKPSQYEAIQTLHRAWLLIETELTETGLQNPALYQQITTQVRSIDQLVGVMQKDAEQAADWLRLIFLTALVAGTLLTIVVLYWLRVRFQQPLQRLQSAAQRIGQGDFTARVPLDKQRDELNVLGETINKMADTIGYMYGHLEHRVDEQTKQLQRSHTTLQLLYDISTRINEHTLTYDDFQETTLKLRDILKLGELELCLVTETGEFPYLQFHSNLPEQSPCAAINCFDCIRRDDAITVREGVRSYFYPLKRDDKRFGVLVARCPENELLQDWQKRLLKLVSDQLAIALSLKFEEDQVRRLAMVNERTVIARELHDSLAQALSYLKIQVTRLNRALKTNDQTIINDVSQELKHGLDSAYRQLRELLTTFRLKIDGEGLLTALETTVKQLQEQSNMAIYLNYKIGDVPLDPQEEIHLLQMIREACQNAIHHSQGTELHILLEHQVHAGKILLSITDNGVGISDSPERLNHYGLAIIKERGRHLGGEAEIKRRPEGGTLVYFEFIPKLMQSRAKA